MVTTAPSAKQYVGWAVEVTQGTAVTPNTWTQPMDSFTGSDRWVELADKALRGSMVEQYGTVQGPKHGEFTGAGACFIDGLGFLLDNILGDLTTTGPVSSSYVHAFSTLNSGTAQPGSLTLVDYNGLTATSGARMWPGACLSELVLKGNPESTLIEMSFKGMSYPSQPYPTAAPVNTPTAVSPLAAWRVALAINDIANLTAREWQVTITRELSVQHTSQNSQNPYIIQRGKVGAAATVFFAKPADESALNYYLDNSQPELAISVSNGGAAAALLTMLLHMQVAAADSAEVNRSDPAVGYDLSFKGMANTTDAGASGGYSPIKVTLGNAVTTY